MPGLSLFAVSQPLLSAALAVSGPSAPVASASLSLDTAAFSRTHPVPLAPQGWTLIAQDQTDLPEGGAQTPAGQEPQTAPGQDNEIIIEGSYGPPKSDPAERINAESYRITQAVDKALVEPLAHAYRDGLPGPLRDGLGNVVRNLGEPSNALNFLLQGKVGKAFETLGRLAINSTLGIGGLIDIAGKPGIGLPYRRNGFANTFGYYGVGSGPYLYIPVAGATSARDLFGNTLDQLLLPVTVGKPFSKTEYAVTYFVVNGLDSRIAFDDELAEIRASEDPYAMRRDTYLARRKREIAALKGEVIPEPEVEDVKAPVEMEPVDMEPVESDAAAPSDIVPPQSDLSLPERVQLTASDAPGER